MGLGFLIFETLWKNYNFRLSISFKNLLPIFKKEVSVERANTPLCVCILPRSLFVLSLCLQPSKKSVGEFFINNFNFLLFFQKITHQI